jgi:hypothetical protein
VTGIAEIDALAQLERTLEERRAADHLESRIFSFVSPHLSMLRDEGRDASNSRRALAAADVIAAQKRGSRWSARIPPRTASPRANARCVDQTLTIHSLRVLAFMRGLGTTGILIPRSLKASRMRPAWMASTHAMLAPRSIM